MTQFLNKIIAWVKSNYWIAGIGFLAIFFLLFPRKFKKLIGVKPRRRRPVQPFVTRTRRRMPRSVGIKRKNKGSYTKGGAKKKAWQIKGSRAAKLHMAKIRRMR
jgi:hypothetical protein